ncbi:unnamed protein product [Nezara viridula]|uniref:Uncharacterized protein n=1 Tax=Nezara viridula TaxID=85310 RepID=A0A9P0HTB8_NEZVI|nr:unnamed protein product [Nezara viridula]
MTTGWTTPEDLCRAGTIPATGDFPPPGSRRMVLLIPFSNNHFPMSEDKNKLPMLSLNLIDLIRWNDPV